MDEKAAAARKRIIDHMNQDHQDSLVRYLQFYCRQPTPIAQHARIEDITLEHMILTAKNARLIVPFQPPMETFAEVRERAAKMDHEALEGLGRSDITVQEYRRPKGFHLVVFITCLTVYIVFSTQGNLVPGFLLHDKALVFVPAFARFLQTIQPTLIFLMVVIHATEGFLFERTRLYKYNVPRLSRLWWMWMVSVCIEGYGSFQRIDRLVQSQREAKMKRKH
ncbi:MAG: hypothetical protein M1817_002541 [Caeruleum heppii]|nr:MAG: hypothetical protein M1817_002541 [Caeruleum heppii]